MAAKRAERLVNLVIALLSTRQYVTAARIRGTVPGYEPDDGTDRADEAFKRMFERDKAELREMGVPLETGRTSVFDTEDGYRIARADYELPEIRLTGEEAAAVGLALRLWESAQLAGAAHSALVKLKAAGVDVDSARAIPLQPRLDAGEPAFEPCYAAARDRRALEFDYQRPDEDAPARRHVQPWGVVAWHGRWYLGRPRPRPRRRAGLPALPRRRQPQGHRPGRRLRAARRRRPRRRRRRPGRGRGAPGRRPRPAGHGRRPAPLATPLGGADDGDDRLELRTTEPGRLADQLAAYGADVVVEAPAEVRDAVIARLTRLAAMGETRVTPDRHHRPGDPAAGPRAVPDRPARGVRVAEAARDFGVTERQLRSDLELLWMCGLPGYGPGDLIDLSFEGDRVRVTFTAGMVRPLRLTTDEAVALVVALRTLLELPGLAEREAVSRALAKVSAAAGHAADRVTPVAVSVDAREEALAVVRDGLERKRALHLHYYVPTRDERTERTVDPMRLLLVDGQWYLEAWCRRAEGVRLFRLDRVDDVVVLDEPAAPPPQAHERDVDNGVYQPEPESPAVRLRLARSARWVADYYPVDSVTPRRRPPAASAVTVRTADLAWARRLVASLGGEARGRRAGRPGRRDRRRRPGGAGPVRRRRPPAPPPVRVAPCCC